jgi:hypothetical protein
MEMWELKPEVLRSLWLKALVIGDWRVVLLFKYAL